MIKSGPVEGEKTDVEIPLEILALIILNDIANEKKASQ